MMNIVICLSPLQVLIAERIRYLYPEESFYGIMYAYNKNDKVEHYYKRMQSFCDGTYLFVDEVDRSKSEIYMQTIRLLWRGYRLPQAKRIFVASIDLLATHLLLCNQSKAQVVTYDDGTINLNEKAFNQIMYKESGRLQKLLHKLLGVPTVRSLLDRQSLHYSIYPYPNVLPNVRRIELFASHKSSVEDDGERVAIFLGQPIYQLEYDGRDKNAAYTSRVLHEYGIEQYYPHPREEYEVGGVEYIHSPLIFEDYILQALDQYPSRTYLIYGFCSSVVLNLQGIERLEFVSLRPKQCPEYLEETYQLFERCGIRVEQLAW